MTDQKTSDFYFPIKTATACQSKWTWSTVWLTTGKSSSCHRVSSFEIPLDNFGSFHNLPAKIDDRQKMLAGEWPTQSRGCSYCRDLEEAGGMSDRMHNNDIPGLSPPELFDNEKALYVSPTIVEIFAENTCNFSCVYCNQDLSSRIEVENKKHGYIDMQGELHDYKSSTIDKTLQKQYYEKFFEWLEENIHTLHRLHLLGGETFVQHDLITKVLNLIEEKNCPQLQLCIFSNMCPPGDYFKKYINRIKELKMSGKLGEFDLTASIDNWGPQAEYVRNGLDCELFEKNFAYAANETWINLNVNQTVTSLTMKTMPELIEMFNKYKTPERHIGHYFAFGDGYFFLHPHHYAYEFWEETFDKIFDVMHNITEEDAEAIERMQGLQKQCQLKKVYNWKKIKQTHNYLDLLDKRRGTDWRKTFPYLDIKENDMV